MFEPKGKIGERWSDEVRDLVKALRADGQSSAEIAREISGKFKIPCTRNAVIGIANRMGMATRQKDWWAKRKAAAKKVSIRAARSIREARPARAASTGPHVAPRQRLSHPSRASTPESLARDDASRAAWVDYGQEILRAGCFAEKPDGVLFINLQRFHCRWPHGDGEHLRFCGATIHAAGPYCAGHALLALPAASRAKLQGELAGVGA